MTYTSTAPAHDNHRLYYCTTMMDFCDTIICDTIITLLILLHSTSVNCVYVCTWAIGKMRNYGIPERNSAPYNFIT